MKKFDDYSLSKQSWLRLCKKFNVPSDFIPKCIGAGRETKVFSFGPSFVLKFSRKVTDAGKAVLKTKRKTLPYIAKCLAVVRASSVQSNDAVCIVVERCISVDDWDEIEFIDKFANYYNDSFPEPDQRFKQAKTLLKKTGCRRIHDLISNNIMKTPSGELVISDHGCLLF